MDTSLKRPGLLDSKRKDISSMLVHDLRNLLTSIHFLSEYVMGEDTLQEEEREEITRELYSNVKNASDICLNLYFSHCLPDAADRPEFRHFDSGELLERIIQSYAVPARKKDITVTKTVGECWIESDNTVLELILKNLISNAVKFTPRGGKIAIHSQDRDGELLITVSDTGSGIPAGRQKHVFKPDMVPAYGTDNEKGAGLGLYLCWLFTAQLGGRVWFSSTPDKGSEFSVALPVRPENELIASLKS